MLVAYELLNNILEDTFEFKKKLWTLSGKRGIHFWVLDHKAMSLNVDFRKRIVVTTIVFNIKKNIFKKLIFKNLLKEF